MYVNAERDDHYQKLHKSTIIITLMLAPARLHTREHHFDNLMIQWPGEEAKIRS